MAGRSPVAGAAACPAAPRRLPHLALALALALAVARAAEAVEGTADSASAPAADAASPSAAAPTVVLDAPDAVRPLLERHLRLLHTPLPAARPDRAAALRRARREAASLLATEGYFSPEVALDRGEGAAWRLVVAPGPRSTIESVAIDFAGDLAGPGPAREKRRAALRAAWSLKAGEPFRQAAWDAAKEGLLDGATVRDYPAARIADSRAEVDPTLARVKLGVTLDSGPAFFLGPLEVSGVSDLPPGLVERYSTLKPGEPYDQDRLLALQTALQNTPYFASVIVDVDPDPAQAGAAPVRVHVSEARPKRVRFGVGASSNTGARVEANYRDTNWLHRALELSTGLRLEQKRQSAYADVFLPPDADRHRDAFGALVERSDLQGLRLTKRAVGVTRSKTRGDIETQIALRVQHETQTPDGAESTNLNALTANWRWIRRKVDDVLDPRRGTVLEFQVGGGARAAFSDQDFVRTYVRAMHYWPFGERDVLIVRGEAGATLAPSRDGIPQDFLFRTGGTQSVRGYAYQSLGVKEGDAVVGGRYLVVGSAEYVHWVRPKWGVAGFVDAGDAADSRGALDPRVGYGVGARWKSPAGPLAVDLAWGDKGPWPRLHFGVAIAF